MTTTGKYLKFILFAAILTSWADASSQTKKFRFENGQWIEVTVKKPTPTDTLPASQELVVDSTLDVSSKMFLPYHYSPVVFDSYDLRRAAPQPLTATVDNDEPVLSWVNDRVDLDNRFKTFKQNYVVAYPELVRYNINTLPEAPKQYIASVDPASAKITIQEISVNADDAKGDVKPVDIKRRNWLHNFNGLVQFSQAYNSPNWYQGGNNNLNALMNAYYNVKLNPAFHPNLLFENTLQYKLGMNNAPDDEMHDYNISEDLFQWNMTAGYKANKRWYYSMNTQFKTQILNNYKPNSNTLKAAFMSPGELNIGLGMTYNYANKNKTFTFDASISPLSYNLKTCTRGRMKETSFGIEEGRKTVSEYGSNAEGKLTWQILENISLRSRLFVFSDYDYIQSDWENTIQFTVNRFLSTQIYVHMRYDSTSPVIEDTDWHKFQLKEILSFGFTYKFGN